MSATDKALREFMRGLKRRNPHETEFHQAVEEVATSVMPCYLDNPSWRRAQILERMTEPDRIISFRVCWETDSGEIRANRAWRVQFNHSLGPYKGGLRFAPGVNGSVLKFLGFEQTLKNALTGLPMGGAKGGANFNPAGKSDAEVMRFCQSMMTELHRHIGENTDVPAGDIGVGNREISYLFGHYMRLQNRWSGVLTGKGCAFGGSAVRTEATGFGCVYFCETMLAHHEHEFADCSVLISGSGNVALHAAGKAIERGARVLTLSDSGGFLHFRDGLDAEQLAVISRLKLEQRAGLQCYEGGRGVSWHPGGKPWAVAGDVAMPCATQNEISEADARTLTGNGVLAVCEGANMPTTADAARVFREAGVLHAPGKAANAGGVAVSGLEQSQNAMRTSWSHERVDKALQGIIGDIHAECVAHGGDGPRVNYTDGANLAGFLKVARAMFAYGVV